MALDEICPPPDGFCGCVLCDDHFWSVKTQERERFRYQCKLSDNEAAEFLQHLLGEIDDSVNYLGEKLMTHGGLIMNRWSKKSKEKRAITLSTAAGEVFGEWPTSTLKDRILAELAAGTHQTTPNSLFAMTPDRIQEQLPFYQMRYNLCPFGEWLDIKDCMEDRM